MGGILGPTQVPTGPRTVGGAMSGFPLVRDNGLASRTSWNMDEFATSAHDFLDSSRTHLLFGSCCDSVKSIDNN